LGGALKVNPTLTELSMQGNFLEFTGTRVNFFQDCNITTQGAQIIFEALKTNNTVTKINMSGRFFLNFFKIFEIVYFFFQATILGRKRGRLSPKPF
jgi:hypothetical protein